METKKPTIKTLGEYQRALDRFENFNDGLILPDLFLIIRVDARRFGPQWENVANDEYPYSPVIVESFLATARSLMCSGFRTLFATMHGDEVSLVLDPLENVNPRRRHKLISLVASAAAVSFLQHSGLPVLFHAKLSELPTLRHVIDYFLWQRKVATRNFIAKLLRTQMHRSGMSQEEIELRSANLIEEERLTLAMQLGISSADISLADRFGSALWWEEISLTPSNKEASCRLVETSFLPESEEEYLAFLEFRLTRPGFLAETPLGEIQIEKVHPEGIRQPKTNEREMPLVRQLIPNRTKRRRCHKGKTGFFPRGMG